MRSKFSTIFLACIALAINASVQPKSLKGQERLFGGGKTPLKECMILIPTIAKKSSWGEFARRELKQCEHSNLTVASQIARDPWSPNQQDAIVTLARLGHHQSLPLLIELATNRFAPTEIRILCIEAIACVADDSVVAVLINQLDDPRVCIDALRCLLMLEGNPLGLNRTSVVEIAELYDSWTVEGSAPDRYSPYLERLAGFRSCEEAGYGANPVYRARVLRNELPPKYVTRCVELKQQYQEWLRGPATLRRRTHEVYRYLMTMQPYPKNQYAGSLKADDFEYSIFRDLVEHPETTNNQTRSAVLRLAPASPKEDLHERILTLLRRAQDIKLKSLVGQLEKSTNVKSALVLLDPLRSVPERRQAAADASNAGLAALRFVATNPYDNVGVRRASVQRIGELTIGAVAPDEAVRVSVADPELFGVAMTCLENDLGKRFFDPLPTAHWARFMSVSPTKRVNPTVSLGMFEHLVSKKTSSEKKAPRVQSD